MLTGGRRHVVRDIYMPTAGESSEDTYAPTQKQKHDYIESAVETGGYIAYRYSMFMQNIEPQQFNQ